MSEDLLCYPNKTNRAMSDHEVLKYITDEQFVDLSNLHSWISMLVVSLMIFFLILIGTIYGSRQTKKKYNKMKLEWFDAFHAGREDLIDWNKDLVLQAEFFPYKSEFELPSSNLITGKELGRGQFGIVYKGLVKGLGKDGDAIEVAVKKSKNLKLGGVKAFAHELKIMMFLQKVNKQSHVNIINLIGSITVDMKKGNICAILEFCRYGSLKDFISKHLRNFVDIFSFKAVDAINNDDGSLENSLHSNTKNHGYR